MAKFYFHLLLDPRRITTMPTTPTAPTEQVCAKLLELPFLGNKFQRFINLLIKHLRADKPEINAGDFIDVLGKAVRDEEGEFERIDHIRFLQEIESRAHSIFPPDLAVMVVQFEGIEKGMLL